MDKSLIEKQNGKYSTPIIHIECDEHENKKQKEIILCAAVWVNDGRSDHVKPLNIEVGFVVCGHRHSDCYATLKRMDIDRDVCDFENEGFITSANRFLNRSEAAKLAKLREQIVCEYTPSELRSEDLYFDVEIELL